MKKVLFIDRDGTIIREPSDEQVDSLEKLSFIPGAIGALSYIAKHTDYELVLVTNQDGLGTESFPEETFWPVQNKMLETLKGEGIEFAGIFIDRTFPYENAPTRKPGTAMLTRYLAGGVDLDASYVIGDRITDVQLATNLGCKAVYFNSAKSDAAALCTTDWNEVCRFLVSVPRSARVSRKTRETDIEIELNIDGTGKSNISTGLAFLDHMLDQLAKHGDFDLSIRASGDLRVDAHHLVEDLAIGLGEVFSKAAGKRKGIERYSFVLPMDDCLASVSADLGGRPWLMWDAEFHGEKTGEVPNEMFQHFFKSFCDNARCNLNIRAEGTNDHHKIESIFKAFARTMKGALAKTGTGEIPSTKGLL
jgi:imidazoleglycerol-phosphate dehydratase/histidinol-phosphatase